MVFVQDKFKPVQMKITRNIVFIISVLAIFSCIKIQTLPPEPSVKYTSFRVFDTIDTLHNSVKGGELRFYFEDGDGDLGYLKPSVQEEGEADESNLFFSLFRINNGVVSPATGDDPLRPSNYRLPYIERPGQNKILKGTVSVIFMYLFYSAEDTIKYEFYLKDRAGNVSNTASTGIIPLYYNGMYTGPD